MECVYDSKILNQSYFSSVVLSGSMTSAWGLQKPNSRVLFAAHSVRSWLNGPQFVMVANQILCLQSQRRSNQVLLTRVTNMKVMWCASVILCGLVSCSHIEGNMRRIRLVWSKNDVSWWDMQCTPLLRCGLGGRDTGPIRLLCAFKTYVSIHDQCS